MPAHSACSAVFKGLLCRKDLAAMIYIHLFLGILLVPLMGLDGDQGPCPTPCRCTLKILNCSRITNSPGFHRVPIPRLTAPPHPFTYLDFTGNKISSIGKEAWKAYPWTEHLVLKDNILSRLQNTSLEGLLSLTYLDLSCNKIQIIERNAFEAVPFLQIINLSGNVIERIAYGTFRAWHGMQFLLKVDLSHNPLAVIQDSHFYSLPSLRFLDLGSTEITPKILEDLLQTSLKLRTLILPPKMFCCLCHIKEDIEVLSETIKLECTESCAISETLCNKEEPLKRMQEEVMKVLEIRKMNGRSLLNILAERAIPKNDLPERPKPNHDKLALAENYSSLPANFNLLESAKRLMQVKAEEFLDINWAAKDELKKLYLLACLLQEVLKERIVELEKEETVQNELSSQASEVSTDEAATGSTDASLRKARNVRKVMRETWLGTNQRQKDRLSRLSRNGREVADTAAESADKPSVSVLHNEAGSWRKLVEGLDSQHALPSHRSRQRAFWSSWKRSVSDSLTNAFKPTGSIIVDNRNSDLTGLSGDGNAITVLGNEFGAPILTKEEPLIPPLHRSNRAVGDDKSKILALDPDPSLNELSPDITLSHGTYWEHQRTSASPSLNLAPQNDYLLQGDLFEAELDKQLTVLIPNAPVRRLISHVIRILKMDCMAPTTQMACTKLISKTGLLMKLFSENINETSSLWKSYFWPSKNAANTTMANSRKLEKPLGKTTSQGIPGYENKLLWAVSVTAIIVIIIAVICLIEICSQRSAAKGRPFLGEKKKPLPDLEDSRADSVLVDQPLWLKDMYQAQDDTKKNSMMDKLHDEESSEEVDIVKARPSLLEPPMKKMSSKTLSVPTYETPPALAAAPLPPPPPPSAPTKKPSMKKSSATIGATSEATTSRFASSEADEDDEEEEEEDAVEKSEAPATGGMTEAPESEEEEGEEDEEESD